MLSCTKPHKSLVDASQLHLWVASFHLHKVMRVLGRFGQCGVVHLPEIRFNDNTMGLMAGRGNVRLAAIALHEDGTCALVAPAVSDPFMVRHCHGTMYLSD